MKRIYLSLGLFLSILLLAPCAYAQRKSPWFRGNETTWNEISKRAFSAKKLQQIRRSAVLDKHAAQYPVRTSVRNWISFRTAHRGVFSAMEKSVLRNKSEQLLNTLGKLNYLQDRDQLLFQAHWELDPDNEDSQQAFTLHQDVLAKTQAEIENLALETGGLARGLLYHSDLKTYPMKNLFNEDDQPLYFVLNYKNEMTPFPHFSLEQQRSFVQERIDDCLSYLTLLLQKSPDEMKLYEFEKYYRTKMRLNYLTDLQDRLAQVESPLPSMVLRRPFAIDLPFLPNPDEKLTDAQRLGKLLLAQVDNSLSAEQRQQVEQEYQRQQKLYSFYANVEAFEVPLHDALEFYNGGIKISDMFGSKGAKIIQQARDNNTIASLIPPVLRKIRIAQEEIFIESKIFLDKRAYVQMFQLEEKFYFYKHELDMQKVNAYLAEQLRKK